MPFTLPPLGCPFNALEPHIDAQTMEIHHDKHHAAYVNNLNTAVKDNAELSSKSSISDLAAILSSISKVPEAIR